MLPPSGSVVYTPKDEGNWVLGNLNVQITDLGYSQIAEHLGKVSSHFSSNVNRTYLPRDLISDYNLRQQMKMSSHTAICYEAGKFATALRFPLGLKGA